MAIDLLLTHIFKCERITTMRLTHVILVLSGFFTFGYTDSNVTGEWFRSLTESPPIDYSSFSN